MNQAPPTRCIQPVVVAGIFFFLVAGINDSHEAKVAFSSPPSVPGCAVWMEFGQRFPTGSLTDAIAPLLCGQYFPLKRSKCCHFSIATDQSMHCQMSPSPGKLPSRTTGNVLSKHCNSTATVSTTQKALWLVSNTIMRRVCFVSKPLNTANLFEPCR